KDTIKLPSSDFAKRTLDEFQNRTQSEKSENRVGRLVEAILVKHQTSINDYAIHHLNLAPRSLQRIIKGDVNPTFEQILKIAEDHGEPLELFRSAPLPKGHYLAL